MPTFPSSTAQSNVRWDDVVDSTLIQSLVTPAVLQRRDEDARSSDVRVHVQLFGALASVTTERTLDIVVPKPTTIGAVVATLGERLGEAFLARVLDNAGMKQRYCRLFVAGVQIEDMRTPVDTDSIEIDMILLVAIEGG
jgi:hypothetical protein